MDLITEFHSLLQSGDITINELSAFLLKKQAEYVNAQVDQLEKSGFHREVAYNKASQSWRVYVGGALQGIIYAYLQNLFEEKGIKLTSDKLLMKQKTSNQELDLVRRMLLIHYGKYSFLPDADIIIYTYHQAHQQVNILAVISIKNSFRERGFETTYWSVKLKENLTTKHIKFYLSTPDVDDEISYIDGHNGGARKMRVIMEYELDGIYMLRQRDFERTEKVKGFEELFKDILALIEKQAA